MNVLDRGNPVEKGYGYSFLPREYENSPGHPQLKVIFRSTPTVDHFDPEKLHIHVRSDPQRIEVLNIHHPWPWEEQYRAIAGRIILQDRKGKKFEAFTFGGNLSIKSQETMTECIFTSPAPILELIGITSIPEVLAEEIEILFAERRAEWEPDLSAFESKLAEAEPFLLYCACLEVLRGKFEQHPSREDEAIQQFVQFLKSEIQTLQKLDKWPGKLPTIAELL